MPKLLEMERRRYLSKMLVAVLAGMLFSCQRQNKSAGETKIARSAVVNDTFNIKQYDANADSTGWYAYVTVNGDSIKEMGNVGGGYYRRTITKGASFYELNEEFYNSGSLRLTGKTLVKGPRTGTWEYFDEHGKLQKQDNEDSKFGKFGPNQLLNALEQKRLINTKTGAGKNDLFSISYEQGSKQWRILYSHTLPVIEHTYIFDGATGKLISHVNAKGARLPN